ncbi:hypothetical protein BDF22DRAFT_652124 [Syncephalis plumigaleata]|nr:hypothetical protein BDF22DRAFT_652124 [Syncephalis plumigaleata]
MPRIPLLGASVALIALMGCATIATAQQAAVPVPTTQDSSQNPWGNHNPWGGQNPWDGHNSGGGHNSHDSGTPGSTLPWWGQHFPNGGNWPWAHGGANPFQTGDFYGGLDPFDSGLDGYAKKKSTGETQDTST